MTDEMAAAMFPLFLKKLEEGVPLTGAVPQESWRGASILYKKDPRDAPSSRLHGKWFVRFATSSTPVPWEVAHRLTVAVPHGLGENLLPASSLRALFHMESVIARLSTRFTLPRISREGGATQTQTSYVAVFEDVEAAQRLTQMAPLIQRVAADEFFIPYPLAAKHVLYEWVAREKQRLCPPRSPSSTILSKADEKLVSAYGPMKPVHREPNAFQKSTMASFEDCIQNPSGRSTSRVFGIWATPGAGKTAAGLALGRYLVHNLLITAPYIMWFAPRSAITSLLHECKLFSIHLVQWSPTKNAKRTSVAGVPVYADFANIPTGSLVFINHDHARAEPSQITEAARNTFVVVDEVHKLANAATQRSRVLSGLFYEARYLLWMTGTAVCSNDLDLLARAAQPLVDYAVTERNALVACSRIRVATERLAIPADFVESQIPVTDEERVVIRANTTKARGGELDMATKENDKALYAALEKAMNRELARLGTSYARDPEHNGVVIAALNMEHARTIIKLLEGYGWTKNEMRYVGTDAKDAYSIPAPSLTLHNRATVHPTLRILVVPITSGESFNCQRFNVMLYFPVGGMTYKLEQLFGRIRRPGQERVVLYHLLMDVLRLGNKRYSTQEAAASWSASVRQNMGMIL